MTKYKITLIISLILSLSILIIGCGTLAKPAESPQEISGQTGELPVWLSLAHYEGSESGETEGGILGLEEADDEDDFFLGLNDQSMGTAPASAPPAPYTQPAATGKTGTAASSSDEDNSSPSPEPGTMAYIIWQQEQREAAKEAAKKAREKEEEVRKTLQERVWEMTHDSLSPSLDVDIKEPSSDEGQHTFELE